MHTLLAAFLALFSFFSSPSGNPSGPRTAHVDDRPQFAADALDRSDLLPAHHDMVVEMRESSYPDTACNSCQTIYVSSRAR